MGYDRGLTVFHFDFLNQMEFHLVQNRKENCHHDHIPINVKGNGNIVFSVYMREKLMPSIGTTEGPLIPVRIILLQCSWDFWEALNFGSMIAERH